MIKDNGGPAFPLHGIDGVIADGMSLRDYYAGQSITGICPGSGVDSTDVEKIAMWAYRLADAMLKERDRD